MAANKFARMLNRNCHKIIVILVYTVAEWILILLLLLNSTFTYIIGKFANFFGLKPSCTWCCRLDHIFDSKEIVNSHFDHVCEAHGAEISKLSYCTNHKRLSESKNLCSDCSSSTPLDYGTINDVSSVVAFFTWMNEGISENGEENRCSCCDEILSRKVCPPSLIFKPSWDVVDYIHKKASFSQADQVKHKVEIEEKGGGDVDDERALDKDVQLHSDGGQKTKILEEYLCRGNRCEKSDSFEVQEWNSSQNDDPFWNLGCNEDDESVYLADMLLQNADYTDLDRFICIELIDTPSVSSQKALTNCSDTDSTERSTRLMEENEKRDDDGEATRVKEPEDFPESEEKKDYNMLEPDDYDVGGTILRYSSDAKFLCLSEEQEANNRDEAKEERHSCEDRSGLDDCLDGSFIREMEVDEYLSRENLKTTIKAQEEALKALYAELEEERKASEEAAKETMAMITKLQEEKAAMQIEAFQYQRMMEEQAEYDQEALQLLNDLMMKREKEKKELEKEMEIYRSKVIDYEAREKTMMIRRRNGGLRRTTSTASSGNDASNDDHSIDLDCDNEYDDSRLETQQEHNLDYSLEDLEETGRGCITNLTIPDVSLAEFDEERLSILEELKILEAKLFALHDEETRLSRDANEEKGTLNSNEDHERETIDVMAKELLPLFDATENENEFEEYDKVEMSNHSSDMESSKILIQEEIGHVYERLQALEEDKDFLKHCISSMMKGNKGLILLQEILQHLRDLKSVELSARNMADIPLSDASMIKEDQI